MKRPLVIVLFLAAYGIFFPSTAARAQVTLDFISTNDFSEPYGITVGSDNAHYFTDSANHRVIRLNSDNGEQTAIGGVRGLRGLAPDNSTDALPGLDVDSDLVARLFSPRGLDLTPNETELIVADTGNHRLISIDLTTTIPRVRHLAGSTTGIPGTAVTSNLALDEIGLNSPTGVAVDSQGRIYVSDTKNNRILRIDRAANPPSVTIIAEDQVTGITNPFNEPTGITLTSDNKLYVANTRAHSIWVIDLTVEENSASLFAGSPDRLLGSRNSIFADDALFNGPSGVLWVNDEFGLLVADTSNHLMRRIFFDQDINDAFEIDNDIFSVETFAGKTGQRGFVNGGVDDALMDSPISLAQDAEGGLVFTDFGNDAIRRVQLTPPKPQVTPPQIGLVSFVTSEAGFLVTKLIPFDDAVFNNTTNIAMLVEDQSETFYTFGTSPDLLGPDTIPIPNSTNSLSPPPYRDGTAVENYDPISIVDPAPDITIKAVSTGEARRASTVTKARVRFKVAPPLIRGDNPASFELSTETATAEIWYTIDGSLPTNGSPSRGPVASGETVGLSPTEIPADAEEITIRAKAFRENFTSSEVATKSLSTINFKANRISFGFDRGEGSSAFVASAGQRFYAPITLSILEEQEIFSLQFNVEVGSLNNSPSVTPGAFGFDSMLERIFTTDPLVFDAIEAVLLLEPRDFLFTDVATTNSIVTNSSDNILGVGYIKRAGEADLFISGRHDLAEFSRAHDTRFEATTDLKTIVGGYHFSVPDTAELDDVYEIKIGRPSATSDGISQDVFIDAPSLGSLSNGTINATKHVRIAEQRYIVGDVAPFRWFNAGDFGDSNLLSGDVIQVYQSAILGVNAPPAGSDMFDAMDSCCIGLDRVQDFSSSNLSSGDDIDIDEIAFGDGVLNVADIFVTFRRSLDRSLTWYERFFSNGIRQAETTDNLFRGIANLPATDLTINLASIPETPANPRPLPSVRFYMEDVVAAPGDFAEAEIYADVAGPLPLKTLMLDLTVQANSTSSPFPVEANFEGEGPFQDPTYSTRNHRAHQSMVWLDTRIDGITGNRRIGLLSFQIPADIEEGTVLRVRMQHISGSANGITILPATAEDGLIYVGIPQPDDNPSATDNSLPKGWLLRHFGKDGGLEVLPGQDPDGDGHNNWQEYQAGTHPRDNRSNLQLESRFEFGITGDPVLRWTAHLDRTYDIEAAVDLHTGQWDAVAPPVTGSGHQLQYTPDRHNYPSHRFFRLRVKK